MAIANVGNTSIFFSWVNTTNQLIVMLNGMFESNGSLSVPSLNVTGNVIVTQNISATFLELNGNDLGNELTNIYVQSNSTFVSINTAGTDANTVGAISNGAYGAANAAFVTTNAASNTAQSMNNATQNTFVFANNFFAEANALFTIASSANQMGTIENRIINPDFQVNQRCELMQFLPVGAGGIPAVWGAQSTPNYFSDAWGFWLGGANTAGSFNMLRVTGYIGAPLVSVSGTNANSFFPPPVGNTFLAINMQPGPNTYNLFAYGQNAWVAIQHSIEGCDLTDISFGTTNAKNLMLTFWSAITGNTGNVGQANGALGKYAITLTNNIQSRTYFTTYTMNVANAWIYNIISIPGDTSGHWDFDQNSRGLNIKFILANSPDQQGLPVSSANAWFTTTANGNPSLPNGPFGISTYGSNAVNFLSCDNVNLQLTGMRLRVGTTDVPWIRRPYEQELKLCKRRYQKSYPASIPVGYDLVDNYPSGYQDWTIVCPLVTAIGPSGYYNYTIPLEVEMISPFSPPFGFVYDFQAGGAPTNPCAYAGYINFYAPNGQCGFAYIDASSLNTNSPVGGYATNKFVIALENTGSITWNVPGGGYQGYTEFHYAISADL